MNPLPKPSATRTQELGRLASLFHKPGTIGFGGAVVGLVLR